MMNILFVEYIPLKNEFCDILNPFLSKILVKEKKDRMKLNEIISELKKLNEPEISVIPFRVEYNCRNPSFTFGIDIGSSNSYVAYSINRNSIIVESECGKRSIPSFVQFNESVVVGEKAKNSIQSNLGNTIYDIHRLIGHKFNDRIIQEGIKHWGFIVVNDYNNPKIRVKMNGVERDFAPYEVLRYIIEELARRVVMKSGIELDNMKSVVVTVPAYFDKIQRGEIRKACELAGLDVMKIIDQPIAAAVAYGYKNVKENSNSTLLVYDFRRKSFSISVVEVKKNEIVIKATRFNDKLGGEIIDDNIVKYYIKKLKDYAGVDISRDKKMISKLRKACEDAKIILSEENLVDTDVESDILDDNDIDTTLSRLLFNRLNQEIFDETMKLVVNTLQECRMSKNDINDVIIIGGSSRIPKVRDMLKEYFNGKSINRDINPDEAVVIGVSLLAEDIIKEMKKNNISRQYG